MEPRERTFFEASPVILCITGLADGRIREINDAFLRFTGLDREGVVGRHILDLGLWVDPSRRDAGIAMLRAGKPVRDVTAHLRARGGEERVCVLAADLVTLGGETCILTALTDITDRTRAEAALRESEQRFIRLFHANPLPMSIASLRDGRYLEVNEAVVRHSGFTREELLGRTKSEIGLRVVAADREEMMRRLNAEGRVRDVEVTIHTRRGPRQVLVNSEVITFAGEPAVLHVSVDITERTQAEAEQRARGEEAEAANRAKDEFLAMLGHELRNPLGTITNAVAVLERLGGEDASTRHLTAIINRQTSHLTRLVDDLLDVARVTSGKIRLQAEPVDLQALARRCLETLTHAGRTQQHRVVLGGEPVHVAGDGARLEQVVNNLVDNALKYTPAGGTVTVTTEHAGASAVLRVRDTGRGIGPEILARVFDLFVQEPQALDRTRGGLGLGLTLVRRLVELHGGSVAATSEGPDRGSEFTVRLPALAHPVLTAAREGRADAPAAARPRRVLIVEDGADARESLRLLLEQSEHLVETADDGPSGLLALAAFRPEIALIDIGLPGLDGYTLAAAARRQPETRDIRLVALTGYGQGEDRRRALAAGFDQHVTKPVDPSTLQDLLVPR
jgi:PAS domain S-box-containing protein